MRHNTTKLCKSLFYICSVLIFKTSIAAPSNDYSAIIPADMLNWVKGTYISGESHVYEQFTELLRTHDYASKSRAAVLEFAAQEKQRPKDEKDVLSQIRERDESGLLGGLCAGQECISIAIYHKNGLIAAYSGNAPLILEGTIWKALQDPNFVEPRIDSVACERAQKEGLLCTNNYIVVTNVILEDMNGHVSLGYSYYRDNKHHIKKVLGFVQCVKNLSVDYDNFKRTNN